MGRNLGPLNIKDSYQELVQISGSVLTDGVGVEISSLDITASHALTADSVISASYAQTSTSASYALTASYVEGGVGVTPTLQEVVDQGATTATSSIHISNASNTGVIRVGLQDRVYGQETISCGAVDQRMELIGGASGSHLRLTGDENSPATNSINLLGTRVEVSGSTTFKNNVAISSSLKVLNITYPTVDGTAGQSVLTNGAGVLSFGTPASASYALTATSASHALTSNLANFAASATSASYAIQATLALSASHANNADTATTASYALTALSASYAPAGPTPTLDQVTTAGNTTSNNITVAGVDAGYLIPSAGDVTLGTISGDVNIQAAGAVKNVNIEATNVVKITGSVDIKDSLVAVGLTYPTLDGSSGDVLTTDGLGNLTLQPAAGGAAFPYTGSADISGSIDLNGDLIIGLPTNSTTLNGRNFVGGNGNTISSTEALYPNTNIGGESNEITAGGLNVMLGGSDQQINSSGYRNSILNGWGTATNGIQAGNHQTIVGGQSGNITSTGTSNIIAGGQNNQITGGNYAGIMGGQSNQVQGASNNGVLFGSGNVVNRLRSVIIGGENNTVETGGQGQVIVGGVNNRSRSNYAAVVGGNQNIVNTNSDRSVIVGGNLNQITTAHVNSVVIGGDSQTTSKSNEVVVPNLTISSTTGVEQLIIANYASLAFADDTAAAAGGVPLGGVYQSSGRLQVRIV